jgi:hypothetical protein
MTDEKFIWDARDVLWRANSTNVAGWVDYDPANRFWYARTAGSIENPVVRAEFDNKEAARDFLMFIANAENTYD